MRDRGGGGDMALLPAAGLALAESSAVTGVVAVTMVGTGGELNSDEEFVRGLRRSPGITGRPSPVFLDVSLLLGLILGFVGCRKSGWFGDNSWCLGPPRLIGVLVVAGGPLGVAGSRSLSSPLCSPCSVRLSDCS